MDPTASASRVFSGAMRVGRDHISSMLYTLVLAYTGSVLPLLLLIQQSSRGMWEVLNGEVIAVEILRSIVGAITLALSFPLTNAIATWLAVPHKHGREEDIVPATVGALINSTEKSDDEPLSHPISAPQESGEEEIVEAEIVPPSRGGYPHHDNYHRPADPHSRPTDGYPRPQGGFQRVGDGHLVTGDGYLTSGDRGYVTYTPPIVTSTATSSGDAPTISDYQPRRVRPAGSDNDISGYHTGERYTTGNDSGDEGTPARHGRHSR